MGKEGARLLVTINKRLNFLTQRDTIPAGLVIVPFERGGRVNSGDAARWYLSLPKLGLPMRQNYYL